MLFQTLRRYLPESSLLLGMALMAGCTETTDADNDSWGDAGPVLGLPGGTGGSVPGGAAGGGTPGGIAGGGTDAGPSSTDAGGFLGGFLSGGTGGTAGGTTGGTGGTAGGTAGGTSSLAGKAAGCNSYGMGTPPSKCAGYYCNVSETELAAALTKAGPCGNLNATRVCGGALTRSVGTCARSVKSNILNAADTDAQLRVKIEKCVYDADPAYADISTSCVSCFLDAAQCASDNCLTQCLSGDSSGCDTCRMNNKCNQPVPTCAGFPSPF